MSLWHARQAFAREMALREAADDPNIDEARKEAEWCLACCKLSAKFYAPVPHQVAGDKENPLISGPIVIEVVNFREQDCK